VITWTEDDVYAGLTHPDIATGTALHWLVITVGTGAGGDRTGAGFRTQQPGLPFGASTIIRWKADDSYTDALIWDGSSWVVEPGWILTRGAIAERNDRQTFELRVPRAALGLGDTLDIAMYMVFEGAGFETTFAPIPAGAFADGVYDPDVARWYRFNLAAPEPPAATPSSP
jgi:hypothetical protein